MGLMIVFKPGDLLLRSEKCHQLKRRVWKGAAAFLGFIHIEFLKPPARNNSNVRRGPYGVALGTKPKERSAA